MPHVLRNLFPNEIERLKNNGCNCYMISRSSDGSERSESNSWSKIFISSNDLEFELALESISYIQRVTFYTFDDSVTSDIWNLPRFSNEVASLAGGIVLGIYDEIFQVQLKSCTYCMDQHTGAYHFDYFL